MALIRLRTPYGWKSHALAQILMLREYVYVSLTYVYMYVHDL